MDVDYIRPILFFSIGQITETLNVFFFLPKLLSLLWFQWIRSQRLSQKQLIQSTLRINVYATDLINTGWAGHNQHPNLKC